MSESKHTPGPWEYIASTEHHGPYVAGPFGGDVCDCYTMSNLLAASIRNGGTSYPIPFQADCADANARLIATAPDMVAVLAEFIAIDDDDATGPDDDPARNVERLDNVLRRAREIIAKIEPSNPGASLTESGADPAKAPS